MLFYAKKSDSQSFSFESRKFFISYVSEIKRLYFTASASANVIRHKITAVRSSPYICTLFKRCNVNIYLLLAKGIGRFLYLGMFR